MSGNSAPVGLANLLSGLPPPGPDEAFTTLLERPGVRIERIVSYGHATPPDRPYAQAQDEWVMLIQGAARLWFEATGEVSLSPGDYLLIPAGMRHRVTWTASDAPTVWLAIHLGL